MSPGLDTKLIAITKAMMPITEKMPPRWSTESVVSLMWAGTNRAAKNSATNASGTVIRKHEPHQNLLRTSPESKGPSAAIEPPTADHAAIDLTRAGPDHSAVISARVVGKAMPAATPPRTRAPMRKVMFGAHAAAIEVGMARVVPSRSMPFRPNRSPIAPR